MLSSRLASLSRPHQLLLYNDVAARTAAAAAALKNIHRTTFFCIFMHQIQILLPVLLLSRTWKIAETELISPNRTGLLDRFGLFMIVGFHFKFF